MSCRAEHGLAYLGDKGLEYTAVSNLYLRVLLVSPNDAQINRPPQTTAHRGPALGLEKPDIWGEGNLASQAETWGPAPEEHPKKLS